MKINLNKRNLLVAIIISGKMMHLAAMENCKDLNNSLKQDLDQQIEQGTTLLNLTINNNQIIENKIEEKAVEKKVAHRRIQISFNSLISEESYNIFSPQKVRKSNLLISMILCAYLKMFQMEKECSFYTLKMLSKKETVKKCTAFLSDFLKKLDRNEFKDLDVTGINDDLDKLSELFLEIGSFFDYKRLPVPLRCKIAFHTNFFDMSSLLEATNDKSILKNAYLLQLKKEKASEYPVLNPDFKIDYESNNDGFEVNGKWTDISEIAAIVGRKRDSIIKFKNIIVFLDIKTFATVFAFIWRNYTSSIKKTEMVEIDLIFNEIFDISLPTSLKNPFKPMSLRTYLKIFKFF